MGKATGCFPKSAPVGALFNLNRDEVTLSSAMNFSIPFTVNDVKYQDPGILSDFNLLVKRYCNDIDSDEWTLVPDSNYAKTPQSQYNFNSIPYLVENESGHLGWDLLWKTNSKYYDNTQEAMNV